MSGEPGPREGTREEATWRPGSWQWRSGRGAGAERRLRARRGSARGGIPEPCACSACALRSPSPRALCFLSPSSLRAQGKECSSPSPRGAPPGPPRGGGSRRGPAPARAASGSILPSPGGAGARPAPRRGDRPPPKEKKKNWLPLTVEPAQRSWCQGVTSQP